VGHHGRPPRSTLKSSSSTRRSASSFGKAGMTECTVGATYNPLERIKNGTVGIADPGVEMKIAEDGRSCCAAATS